MTTATLFNLRDLLVGKEVTDVTVNAVGGRINWVEITIADGRVLKIGAETDRNYGVFNGMVFELAVTTVQREKL